MVVNEPTAIVRLSIDVIKLAFFEMGCVESESPAMTSNRRGGRLVAEVTSSRRSMRALVGFCQFAPMPAVKANHQADGANV